MNKWVSVVVMSLKLKSPKYTRLFNARNTW